VQGSCGPKGQGWWRGGLGVGCLGGTDPRGLDARRPVRGSASLSSWARPLRGRVYEGESSTSGIWSRSTMSGWVWVGSVCKGEPRGGE